MRYQDITPGLGPKYDVKGALRFRLDFTNNFPTDTIRELQQRKLLFYHKKYIQHGRADLGDVIKHL